MKSLKLILLLLFMHCPLGQADVITIAADDWCPINCGVGSDREGFMVHMAKMIFIKHGHTVVYKSMPWNRALKQVKAGTINGAIGAAKEECPNCIYADNEQAAISVQIFTLKGSNWRYSGTDSLKNKSIATVADYSYNAEMDDYIQQHKEESNRIQIMYGDYPIERNIKKLAQGRIDMVLATREVFWHLANRMELAHKFQSSGILTQDEKIYIAFSPALDSSKKYTQILSDGMTELRKSGELERIMKLYGLKDWK